MTMTTKALLKTFVSLLSSSQRNEKVSDEIWSDLMAPNAVCSVPTFSSTTVWSHENDSDRQLQEQQQKQQQQQQQKQQQVQSVDGDGKNENSHFKSSYKEIVKSDSLQDNVAAWLRVLIQARLRQYVTILARHGVSIANESECGVLAVERKLAALIDIGTRVQVLASSSSSSSSSSAPTTIPTTRFSVHDDEKSICVDGRVSLPLTFESTLQVIIPSLHQAKSKSVSFTTRVESAKVTGSIDSKTNKLNFVQVQVDTHDLLQQLIHHAGHVMTIVVDHVKEVCTTQEQQQALSLPPMKQQILPQQAAPPAGTAMRVVSPELQSTKRSLDQVSSFQLNHHRHDDDDDDDDDDVAETDTTELSLQSCANIVDYVIGEVNQDLIRPTKRTRMA